ncbi:eukaryotic translation initiation factor 4G-like isoform X2 [Quercus lobata]|uniref:eukaryotic translation initiation factor 4G-like isoform X2 n=1 Tax=Quercus lobata TaxID=97700 RepID=UPI001244C81E|nr:eukaryotic translation initiation factor 4G-like isoform X2 [Quercus lobata]
MSYNQSNRSEKIETTQYRKTDRRSSSSNQQRSSSGAYGKGGGGPAPSPSYNSSNSRSYKKSSNNAQGGQSRAHVPTASVNSPSTTLDSSATTNAAAASTPRTTAAAVVQNGSHVHPQLHADAPVTSAAAKPAEPPAPAAAVQRSTRPVPKAPTSQSSAMSSDPAAAPKTPVKAPGDASKPYPFQFGSISPGFMNGMQVPARTSSAPPNLDEQKRDQARHDSFRPPPPLPIPTAPKQQFPRKDAVAAEKSNTGEAHSVPKVKKDVQVSPAPPASQPQKPPVLPPMGGMSMPMQYHQPQVSVQFAGPNQQLQSQGMTAAPLQMQLPMGLSMANAPQVQPPVFLQPHPMQQGIIHQGQYTAQMGPQLPPQLGNMGMGMTPPYPQQQGGKFGGPRKTTVKITHPDTHEELRLDKRTDSYSDGGSSAPRSLSNMPPQSQPIPSFASSHPLNFYNPNSFNAGSMFYPPQSSVPLTSSQLAPNSQAPRFNYPVGQNPQNMAYMNPSLHVTADLPNLEHSRDVHNIISSAPPTVIPITVKPTPGSLGEKVADSLLPKSSHGVEKSEPTKHVRPSGEVSSSHPQREVTESLASKLLPVATKQSVVVSAAVSSEGLVSNPSSSASVSPSEESVPVVPINEGRRRETLSRSNSIKDYQKKISKKGLIQSQHQVGSQSASISSLPSQALEQDISSGSGVFGTVEAKPTVATPTPVTSEGVSSTQQSLSNVSGGTPDASELKSDTVVEASYSVSSEIFGARIIVDTLETVHQAKLDKSSSQDEELVNETVGKDEQGENSLPPGSTQVINSSEISSEPISLKSSEFNKEVKQSGHDSGLKVVSDKVLTIETAQKRLDEPVSHHAEIDGTTDNLEILNSTDLGSSDVGSSHGEKTSTVDASSSRSDSIGSNEIGTMSGTSDQQSAPIPAPDLKEATSKHEGEDAEIIGGGLAPLPASGAKDKPILDQNKAKVTSKATKKKRKEICLKADAAGTTSDLYNAYKGPEEKKETILSTDYTESISTCVNEKQAPADAVEVDAVASEMGGLNKAEPDDWEDAADLSTPKLEVSDDGQLIHGGLVHYDHDGDGSMAKKYSRDFLLKFSEQCSDLPEDFEITSDIEALMSANLNLSHLVERDSYPSPGRIVDRPSGGNRLDRRGSSNSMGEEERWGRLTGHFAIRDVRLDPVPVYGGNTGFRPGPGGNYGVLRNPRGQAPMQYPGGILSGPSMGSQGGMPRNSPDADRWLRNANIQQKGLFPSPHTPLQMMHKAERKYEVGKVTDEEQAKQRQLKAILNKLTPQNFDKLFEQVKAVNIDNPDTLTGVISQIFDKALMEPTFCEMYANFCSHLSLELPDFSKDNEKITFKRVLLNKCQEEFERGEREQEEANKADEEGEIKQSAEEREEKRIKARRRMLGNIRLIGELYKKKMLTERIMHACIQKLLGQYDNPNPDEEDIEALCKLMSTIGEMIDHSKAKENMDAYFERMKAFSNNMNLSSRVRFMLKDSIDLRKNKWQQRRKVEGPKKIEEVHRDAAQERQAQTSRLGGRGNINTSTRRTPMDFGSRGSTMLSPSSVQMGGFRGLPSQVRGVGGQDVRFEDRVPYEARTLSVPLPQRPIGDDSITLGPQGGLARGMSIRGPPAMSSALAAEISPGAADPRRMAVGLNGYSMVSERTTYGPREELVPRFFPDRFAAPAAYDQSSPQERNVNFGNRDLKNPDRSFDRSVVTSPTPRMEGAAVPQNVPSEKLPEERLKDMSIAAIKEFYSARDEKEVELCIRDMNAPSFHPSMVSLWVTDSFERKDMERDVLTKLLVNLTKSRDGVLNQAQLIKGFESVMTNLEDAVNDAPRAPEFLGHLFAKVITENVVPLSEIGRLIYQGGEEPGYLLECGLAADVLGSTLEVIKSEKGDSVLNELRKSSNLRIEDFRPPNPNNSSRKLDKFI